MNSSLGKYIMIIGVGVALLGAVIYFFGDKFNWLGRLPGDIRIDGKNGGGFYFPLMTCIVVSLVLNLLIVLIRRFFGS